MFRNRKQTDVTGSSVRKCLFHTRSSGIKTLEHLDDLFSKNSDEEDEQKKKRSRELRRYENTSDGLSALGRRLTGQLASPHHYHHHHHHHHCLISASRESSRFSALIACYTTASMCENG